MTLATCNSPKPEVSSFSVLTPYISGMFTFKSQQFPVKDMSSLVALTEKVLDNSEPIKKSQANIMQATI
jgi:hypothetical protein